MLLMHAAVKPGMACRANDDRQLPGRYWHCVLGDLLLKAATWVAFNTLQAATGNLLICAVWKEAITAGARDLEKTT
jgi:hypothetical protein